MRDNRIFPRFLEFRKPLVRLAIGLVRQATGAYQQQPGAGFPGLDRAPGQLDTAGVRI
jgi:hypothetical protein